MFTTLANEPSGNAVDLQSQATLELRVDHFNTRHSEYLLIESDQQLIGWIGGEMFDVETFYIRTAALTPEYRASGIGREVLSAFLTYLEGLGYSRFLSHQLVCNPPAIIRMLESGFIISAMSMDERLGRHVETLRLTHPARRESAERLLGIVPTGELGEPTMVSGRLAFEDLVSAEALLRYLDFSPDQRHHHAVTGAVRPQDPHLPQLLKAGAQIRTWMVKSTGVALGLYMPPADQLVRGGVA